MKLATTQSTKPVAKTKKSEWRVPFNEMCHLMRVYGPIKCLRKRKRHNNSSCNNSSSSSTEKRMQTNSLKRKFYRWFPDLNDRFVKTDTGLYMPKFGHENEMKYREEMRKKDGEILNKKRMTKRRASGGKQQHQGIDIDTVEVTNKVVVVPKSELKQNTERRTMTCHDDEYHHLASTEPVKVKAVRLSSVNIKEAITSSVLFETATMTTLNLMASTSTPLSPRWESSFIDQGSTRGTEADFKFKPTAVTNCIPVSTVTPLPIVVVSLKPSFLNQEATRVECSNIKLDLDHDPIEFAYIVTDTKLLDCSFIAEQGIFDDVEKSFYGRRPLIQDCCPSLLRQKQQQSFYSYSRSSSSLLEEQGSSTITSSWGPHDDSLSINDILDYCEEILKWHRYGNDVKMSV